MRLVLAVTAGLLLAGCVTHEMVDQGRAPTSKREPHDRDYAQRERCRTSPNTDDHLDCIRRETQRDTWKDPTPLPPPPSPRGPGRPAT